MIKINLLPHREIKRKELRGRFYTLMAFAVLCGAAVVVVIGLVFSTRLSAQEERNAFIVQQNQELDKKIKEVATLRQEIDALKARQQAVEDLQADRNQPVFMMNELVKLAPEGLYLTLIKQDGQRISIKGYAQSHAVVGIFVNELNSSQWMNKPEIIQNKAVGLGQGRDAKRAIEFDLNVGIKRPREFDSSSASAAEVDKKMPVKKAKP